MAAPSNVTSTDLTAEILTQSMPLSDAFNKAISAEVKIGVHHGLNLSFDDVLWPNGNFSSKTIKISAGKAVVPAIELSSKCDENVFVSVVLENDLSIDLSAITNPIGGADASIYYVALVIDYTASSVNTLTGLVTNTGLNSAYIRIAVQVPGSGYNNKGLVLGKFCRVDKYIESIGESPIEFSNIAAKNGYGWSENTIARDKNRCMTEFKTAVSIDQFANLKKHVTIEGVTDLGNTPDNNVSVGSEIMPLDDITASVATATSAINGWAKPVDWTDNTLANIYGGATGKPGIWKDVEVFELFNSYFRTDMGIAFHRTSGNGKIYAMTLLDRANNALITPLNDYGSTKFVFDGKGSTWEGDLTIDLVLDFVGKAEDHIYRINLRNLEVKGKLKINYGQSYLGQAGGAFGKIVLDNVHADEGIVMQPWPQVDGLTLADPIVFGPYIGYVVSQLLNNAAGIDLVAGGYSTTPSSLKYWQYGVGTKGWTKGVIIPIRLISSRTGGGGVPPAMGAPYLEELADGGIIFRKSSAYGILFGQSVVNCTDVDYGAEIRIQLRECSLYVKQGTSGGYRSIPRVYKTSNVVVTLTDFIANTWWDIESANDLHATTDVNANASVNAGTNIVAGGNVVVGGTIAAATAAIPSLLGSISVAGNIAAAGGVTASNTVQGAIVKATTYLQAVTGVYSGTVVGVGSGLLKWVMYTGSLGGAGNTFIPISSLIFDVNVFGFSLVLEGTDLVWYIPYSAYAATLDAVSHKVLITSRGGTVNTTNSYRLLVWYY
jgi:hypothetical protein